MYVAQNKTITAMKGIIGASLPMDVINAGRQLVEDVFPDEFAQFADAACDAWDAISNLSTFPANSDVGCTLATKLLQMIPVCSGTFQKVLILCTVLHHIQCKRNEWCLIITLFVVISDCRSTVQQLIIDCKSPLMEREQRILILALASLSF